MSRTIFFPLVVTCLVSCSQATYSSLEAEQPSAGSAEALAAARSVRCVGIDKDLGMDATLASPACGTADVVKEKWSYVTYMNSLPDPQDYGTLEFSCKNKKDGLLWSQALTDLDAGASYHRDRYLNLSARKEKNYALSQNGFYITTYKCSENF